MQPCEGKCTDTCASLTHFTSSRRLISGPSPTVKTRLLSFTMIQSRVVTGLLTGRNTLRRHLYIMGLIDSPHVSEVWNRGGYLSSRFVQAWSLDDTQVYLCVSFFSWTWGCYKVSLGAVWNFIRGTVLPWLGHQLKGHEGPVKRHICIGTKRARTYLLFYSDLL
jgi:hypothetical protein